MKKRKLYGLLMFMLITFTLLGVVISREFNLYRDRSEQAQISKPAEDVLEDQSEGQSDGLSDSQADGQSKEDESVEKDIITEELPEDEDFDSIVDKDDENGLLDNVDEPGLNATNDVVMVFSGDVYLSDYVLKQYENNGIDGILSQELQEEFFQADIAMVNQEFAFSNGGTPMKEKQFTFRVDPKYVQILNDMEIDVVTLANNHTLDYGEEALKDTFHTLDLAKIQYVGAGNSLTEAKTTKFYEVSDKTIAVLGASRVIPVPEWNASSTKPGLFTTYDPTALLEEIKTAKEISDYIVVYVHWGIERNTTPKNYQRNMAKQYIDAGADLVVGSHPHVLQGIEYYKDKPIIYSLGNFMFYNSIDQTAVLKVTLDDATNVQVQILPCKAENARTYQIDDSSKVKEFYQYLTKISYDVEFDETGVIIQKH